MAWPMIAAAAIQMYGQYQAGRAQADAEQKNAEFFRYQEEYAKFATEREKKIFTGEQVYQRSQQQAAIVGSNIDVTSGSALAIIVEQNGSALDELNAIGVKGALDTRMARLRANQAYETAGSMRTATNIGVAGSALGAYGQYKYGSK